MQDFIIGWALNTLFTFLPIVIKNPHTKAQYQRALLKLRNAIDAALASSDDGNLPVSL